MKSSFRMGRVFGIPVDINASWLIVFLLLTFVLAQQFGDSILGWPVAQRWLVAMALVVLFFLSVLIHELSHSVLAVRKGIPVLGITLFVFGGVSRLTKEPDRPLIEFAVAIVGPLSSLVLAGIFGAAWYLLGTSNSVLEVMLFLLAWSNLSLGVFNLLPGFPLDGGRVLRAAIWAITGDHRKATLVATRAGQGIGGIGVISGLALSIFVGPFDGIWLAIVGAFLFSMATDSYRQEKSEPNAPGIERLRTGQDV